MSSSSSPPPPKKKITLKSSDGEAFEVDEEVALQSVTIKDAIEDDGDDNDNIIVPLGNVSGKILAKIIDYCRKHLETPRNEDDLKAWDAEFVSLDHNTLFDLILAANYLHMKDLLDLTTNTVADMIKGKTPEEIRRTFNLSTGYTPEEEEEIRRENQWAFE